jgi:Domain of unknown function (DUF1707)
MDTAASGYPSGDLRVSDADRDRALSDLSVAFQAGRITADEFGQRSAQVMRCRTGKELRAPLADLPLDRPPAARTTIVDPAQRVRGIRIGIGLSAASATLFASVALASALNPGPTLQQRELAQTVLAHQGISIPLPPSPGFDWPGTIGPAVIAVLFIMLIAFLSRRLPRTNRP